MGLIGVWCKLCGQKSVLDYNDVDDGSVTRCDHDCENQFEWKYDQHGALHPNGGNLSSPQISSVYGFSPTPLSGKVGK